MAHRVFVGLSGGVDSAVSAALLSRHGYAVTGIFIKIWRPEFIECTWKEDRLDAMRVCTALGIPFREIDLSDEYKKEVIDSMLASYAAGVTPNPDVVCNRAIKFGAFLKWARSEGADSIATGHYARTRQQGVHLELLRGVDAAKDQSYFLYRLTQQELARVIFPVGGMQKTRVRAAAASFGLPVAKKRDSQGLCFVGEVTLPQFLSRFMPVQEGTVLDTNGASIGTHPGAAFFTIGQRHGFVLRGSVAATPHYVVGIDTSRNEITAASSREQAASSEAALTDLSWTYRAPALSDALVAQTRYHGEGVPARLVGNRVIFSRPVIAPPGQSLVLYRDDVCLGGGTIAAAVRASGLSTAAAPAELSGQVQ